MAVEMSKRCVLILVCAALWLFSACSESIDDFTCQRNDECFPDYACDSRGKCIEAGELKIEVKVLGAAYVGESYQEALSASGGIPTYRWSLEIPFEYQEDLGWIEIGEETGQLGNREGVYPEVSGEGFGIRVMVTDRSNGGSGQQAVQEFELEVEGRRGDVECWEPREGACQVGTRECEDGQVSEECVISGWSVSMERCGSDCGECDAERADRCLLGECACGQAQECQVGERCCQGRCVDLASSVGNCGECGIDCGEGTANVVEAICEQGECDYTGGCAGGYYDCDGNRANGCETAQSLEHCADCDHTCASEEGSGGRCILESQLWQCGCLPESEQEDCPVDMLCCQSVCTARNEQHCQDCDTGCSIANGGPTCESAGGGEYECRCENHSDCLGQYDFSMATCRSDTDQCSCTGSSNCTEEMGTIENMCCTVGGLNDCVDLLTDADNCGMCGAVCGSGDSCVDGVCTCVNSNSCPETSGAPDCVNDGCACPQYDNDPCTAGQYCCDVFIPIPMGVV